MYGDQFGEFVSGHRDLKFDIISPGVILLRKGFKRAWKVLKRRGFWLATLNRNYTSKQAITVLIKICFAFTGFN